mmetsp:Transcript_125953/g.177707  ORF Transcript_125953/g.177707 Transcript_125953/m.177707 type:complete len:129 (+) Transcript_125953:750-1136(+)
MIDGKVNNYQAVDLYSLGIILFVMKFGILPAIEDQEFDGVNLFKLLQEDPESFWKIHEEIGNLEEGSFTQDFKDLFFALVRADPSKRASIQDIKKSAWYNGETLSNQELKAYMKEFESQMCGPQPAQE